MEVNFLLRAYGVLGYSVTLGLAIASFFIGVAYYRAGRDKSKSLTFACSSFLYAVQFAFLALVAMEPNWLDRDITMPLLRTIALFAGLMGWVYLILLLRKEARLNGPKRPVESIDDAHVYPSGGL